MYPQRLLIVNPFHAKNEEVLIDTSPVISKRIFDIGLTEGCRIIAINSLAQQKFINMYAVYIYSH